MASSAERIGMKHQNQDTALDQHLPDTWPTQLRRRLLDTSATEFAIEADDYPYDDGAKEQTTPRNTVRMIVWPLVGLVALLFLLIPDTRPAFLKFILLIALIGIYPLAYIAYLGFAAQAHRERLKDDFRLLGLEQEEKIDATVEKLYRTVYSPVQFVVYISLIVFLSLPLLWSYFDSKILQSIIAVETAQLMLYGYLGAYVYSVQELVRRYNTFDLQPQVYSAILVRMLMSILIVFAGAGVIELSGATLSGDSDQNPAAWAAVLAFVIGIFPSRGVRWLMQQTNRILSPDSTPRKELPLRHLFGISTWHEARLAQMGIDDTQNLATVDIRKLLLTTQFDTQEIVSWIDQAILYAKVGSKLDRFHDAKITTFHQYTQALSRLTLDSPVEFSVAQKKERIEARKRLALALAMTDEDELERLGNQSDIPNYSHIAEYYSRAVTVARQRARQGMDIIVGALYETDYERAVEEGESRLLQTPNDADLLYNLGVAYYNLDRMEDAFKTLGRSITLNDRLAEAYYTRSLVYTHAHHDYESAIADCTQAISVDPSHAEAFNNRGLAHMELGDLDRAIKDLDQALRLNERLAPAYLNRGIAYNTQSQFESALRDFEKASVLLDERGQELWLSWGKALMGCGDYAQAIDKLSQAIAVAPDSAESYAARGYAYMQGGQSQYRNARRDLNMALKKNPDLANVHSNLGLLDAWQSNYGRAIKHYQQALQHDHNANDIVTRYNLALAYRHLGDLDAAEQMFQQILNMAPSDSLEAIQSRIQLTDLAAQRRESA